MIQDHNIINPHLAMQLTHVLVAASLIIPRFFTTVITPTKTLIVE